MGRRKFKARPVLQWAAVAHLDAACDTDFVCGALLTKDGASTYWQASEGAFVDALLKIRGVVLFHGDQGSAASGALRWILDHFLARNLKWGWRTAAKGQLQTVFVRGTQFRDAKKLWHTDLETFASGTAHPAPKLILTCVCRLDCGGYCSVRGKLAAERRAAIEKRAVDRCRSIWAGLERLAEFQEAADIDGRSSIGSSAWGTVLRRKPLPGRDMSRSRHFFTRRAALPARVEVFRPLAKRGREYDLSMAYTGAMSYLSLPIGEATRIWGADAQQALDAGQPGIYNVLVHSPRDQHLPVLPARSKTGRVGFPTGTFEGAWTGFELNYALQCGYSIDRMYSAQVYDQAKPLFRPWAREMWEARRAAEKAKSPMAGYIKNLANALPGTFGMDGYTEHVVRHPKEKDLEPCPCTGIGTTECPCRGRCCEGCDGECGRLAEWSAEHGIWIRRVFHPLDRAHAVWNVFVLSWCRVEVHRKAIEGGQGGYDLITIGTDGFRCEGWRDVLEMVEGPGGWRLSKELKKLRSPAGNTSVAVDAHTGEMVVRASGHPRALPGGGRLTDREVASRITADRMLTEENHSHWGGRAIGLREGLQRGRTWTVEREPAHHEPSRIVDLYGRRWFSGRILDEGATVTRAPTIDELDEL